MSRSIQSNHTSTNSSSKTCAKCTSPSRDQPGRWNRQAPRPSVKTGRIYRHFKASNGESVTLRALKWEDLDDCVAFINDLVGEKNTEPNLGIIADRKQTREEEAKWLANQLTGIESGSIVSVVAELGGRLAGNSSVTRGSYEDTKHHGYLGIAISRKHRDRGIGLEMMRTLVKESGKPD
ncbi:GNAT family N-acetyltransferase [Candidatus Bathyarchaeota archaeon]|nr:MAG: GNAT family N-acetyltransferase [Candidatus Bathyarchaeota archaeon]